MYETYQNHPQQAKGNVRVVLAVVFLACAIGAGIFLITRLASKPLAKEDARAQTGRLWNIAVHSYVPAGSSTSRAARSILLPTGIALL